MRRNKVLLCIFFSLVFIFSFYASNKGSFTKLPQSVELFSFKPNFLAEDEIEGLRLAVGVDAQVYVFDEMKARWNQLDLNIESILEGRPTFTSIDILDKNSVVIAGHEGLILKSEDRGQTWLVKHKAKDRTRNLFSIADLGENRILAVGSFGYALFSEDSGVNWTELEPPTEAHLYDIAVVEKKVFVVGEFGQLLSFDIVSGNWTVIKTPSKASFFGLLKLDNEELLLYGLEGQIFRYLPNRNIWVKISLSSKKAFISGKLEKGRNPILMNQDHLSYKIDLQGNTVYLTENNL